MSDKTIDQAGLAELISNGWSYGTGGSNKNDSLAFSYLPDGTIIPALNSTKQMLSVAELLDYMGNAGFFIDTDDAADKFIFNTMHNIGINLCIFDYHTSFILPCVGVSISSDNFGNCEFINLMFMERNNPITVSIDINNQTIATTGFGAI